MGALMLVSPHQFANPVYAPFQPYLPLVGMGLLVNGLGLPATLVFAGQQRWLVFAAHIILAAAFASLGVLVISGGAWSGAPSSTFTAVGLLFAAGISLRRSSGQRGPDLFGIAVAATATSLGCMLLLARGQFGSPVYSLLLPHATLVGAALLVGGIATAAAQFGLHHVRPFVWAAHLLLATAYFAVLGLVAIPFAAWTAIPYYGGFGIAIALLPALGPHVERLDPHSLSVRLAVSFALASTLPLVLAMGAVTSQRQFIADGAPNSSQTANLSSRARENISQDQAFEVLLSCIALATVAGALGAKALSAPLRRITLAIEKLPDATQSTAVPTSGLTEMLQLLTVFEATRIQLSSSQQALIHANRELGKASQMKSEFLANMSHELRTPLNAIIGFSEVLLEELFGELNEKQRDYTRDVLTSGQHLLSLINDILDLSKVESGKMDMDVRDFSVREMLESGLMMVRQRAAEHAITLTFD
ncbi:MAG TPA: histidine kinase dimerization/phospho-acceptor domain-containing protein, partial [Chloroflexota bacterium]|nr:histidine kinase dimerization/phospho-acceptor domain-containing protein [Chloroflexota bacterium]